MTQKICFAVGEQNQMNTGKYLKLLLSPLRKVSLWHILRQSQWPGSKYVLKQLYFGWTLSQLSLDDYKLLQVSNEVPLLKALKALEINQMECRNILLHDQLDINRSPFVKLEVILQVNVCFLNRCRIQKHHHFGKSPCSYCCCL